MRPTDEVSQRAAAWLLAWFDRRGPIPGNGPPQQLRVNYFEAGLIDSLGVIELIAEIEEGFGIQFDQEHFRDRRFATIGGLSRMIAELSVGPRASS